MPRRRRRPPPPPPSYFERAVAWIKRNKTVTTFIIGSFVAVPSLWASVEFLDKVTDDIQFARHVYVNGRVDTVAKKAEILGEQNQNILRDLQVDTANGKLDATTNELKRWQVELAKPGNDQRTIDLITQRINVLTATKDKIDAQLKTLTAITGK
jgi:hypothetical protein